ncbi:MAG: class I SAM-dependent DNA methyltransferase, partial [Halochromatium sp.]|uniref:class I SAM-dependent DNA methyltransferase n=1 Tax=Halochromatium sp. TaxID=2049430 RepID=UPI00397A3372
MLALDDLRDHAKRRLLKWAFTEPEKLRPAKTTAALTEQAAARFAELAHTWRGRGHAAEAVAHFSQQLLFCLFAEDIDLLPGRLFSRLLHAGQQNPVHLESMLGTLFGTMAQGGLMGVDAIDWFNGGLFNSDATLPLESPDVALLLELARLDWSAIDPTIVGTLFERGLDPGKRTQLGAHYTDPNSIMRLVDPVVLQPLRDEWHALKARIETQRDKASQARSAAARTKATNAALGLLQGFLDRLRRFRVLDPACGSGNFLLLALLGLKDLEHQVIVEAEAMGLPRAFSMIGPENVLGIELNPFAAELARVVVWIGEIQWMLAHGFNLSRDPILKPLETIENRDAVLNDDGSEPAWPAADAIVGNPPFLGNKRMVSALGKTYAERLRRLYQNRVPGGADLVTYWFEKGRSQIELGKVKRVGLVATNSIRGGASRQVLARITETGTIFNAWSDEPWVNEGAAVRVSLIAFAAASSDCPAVLNGQSVVLIYSDLTGSEILLQTNLTQSARLLENRGVCFMGITKVGSFDISGDQARQWLTLPNPHGRPNQDVLRPWANGMAVTRRWPDKWIIDFGVGLDENEASLYEGPFHHVEQIVKPERSTNRREAYRKLWWRFGEARPGMRSRLEPLPRFIATPEVSKHRFFVWLTAVICPDKNLHVITRADDTTFGILHSRFHELWSLRMGTSLEDRPRYTPTSTFETFPFPEGLTPTDTAGSTDTLPSGAIIPCVESAIRARAEPIAEAAHRLDHLRRNWLNP